MISPDFANLDEQTKTELIAILYGLEQIRQATGFGKLVIEIRDKQVSDVEATHKIRPKFVKTTNRSEYTGPTTL